MPPKDDEDPKSTKEVVTKKQKQMLNREELDLSLIAEAFGGLLLEKSETYSQGSLPYLGRSFGRATADAEQNYEDDLRRGYTDPGGAPRPRGGPEGRKPFNQLINDMKKSQKGKPLVPRTLPSVPERVRQQRAQQYREAGGGRRGQYLRRTGRLPATSNPAKPKPAPSTPKQQYTLKNLQRDVVRGLNVASNIPLLGPAGRALKIGAMASPFLLGVGAELGRVSRKMELDKVKEKELEALKPIKKGTTISVINPLTGKTEQLTQAEYEERTGRRTSVIAPAPAAAPAAAPPETPVIAPPITGIPRGRGGDPTGPGRGGRPDTKKDRKPRFDFPDQPGGKIGRRQNPQ